MKLSLFIAFVVFSSSALAGPPLICHPFEISGAKSLPWNLNAAHWDGKDASYDPGQLIADTLGFLTPSAPVLVRMETMRRAAIYSGSNPELAFTLLAKLRARTQQNDKDALAWFDAGYFTETLRQYEHVLKRKVPAEFDGYAWTQKAIALAGPVPEMEFAAAMMQSAGKWPNAHYHKAKAGAQPGSLLARNLDKWQ